MPPLINRCIAVEDTRCDGIPENDQVLCPKHFRLKDDDSSNFDIAIVPLDEFNEVLY
jgi:hypothetical protein